jgi:hypothetical protein
MTIEYEGALNVSTEGPFLILSAWNHAAGTHGEVAVRIKIPAADVLDFIADVNRDAVTTLRDAIKQLAAGDCGVCGNLGLVDDVAPHGRLTNKHCTACKRSTTTAARALRDAPTYRVPDVPPTPDVVAARERAEVDRLARARR